MHRWTMLNHGGRLNTNSARGHNNCNSHSIDGNTFFDGMHVKVASMRTSMFEFCLPFSVVVYFHRVTHTVVDFVYWQKEYSLVFCCCCCRILSFSTRQNLHLLSILLNNLHGFVSVACWGHSWYYFSGGQRVTEWQSVHIVQTRAKQQKLHHTKIQTERITKTERERNGAANRKKTIEI